MISSNSSSQTAPFKMVLDGEWLFNIDSTKSGVDAKWFAESLGHSTWQKVEVPKFWEGYPGLATSRKRSVSKNPSSR